MSAPSKPKCYNPRHPERTLLYQTVAEHYETWLELASAGQFAGQGDHHSPKPYVRKAFEKYLECGIFAHGFARARCEDCGHDFLVAFSCKGRGVCPSCNTRRMAETAAHLSDHVFPRLPVRQWVLSVPKRLRYFMQRDGPVLNMVLRIFLRVIAQTLQANSPGAANPDKQALHIGAVAFIHRFGSSLNEHVHFHVCAVDDLWAVLIARIYEVFPLLCPICGGQMRIIAFITHSADIRHILEHIGAETEPPCITPARGPPLWDGCDAQMGEGVDDEIEPDWDEAVQAAPEDDVDQRISW
jgi:hypothetical protein